MSDIRVANVVGARPQFIKVAMVSRTIREHDNVQEVLIHTGQHYDLNMSDVFFSELGIPMPKHNLGIGSGRHGMQTGRMLEALESTLLGEMPDCVVVYGDTNSTLAGALAAVKLGIPVAHVEAGLRSDNMRMPEEVNRVVADHVSDILFAPTMSAVQNLMGEGIAESRCVFSGDLMYDSALSYIDVAERVSDSIERLALSPKGYILATVHRAENTDHEGRLRAIVMALNSLSEYCPVVWPLHPRTEEALRRSSLLGRIYEQVHVIDPVGYLDMLVLEKNASVIVSDSGGVPKEGFFLGTPSVILRKEAVWDELVDLGWSIAVEPANAEPIIEAVERIQLVDRIVGECPFGDGHAAERILGEIVQYIRGRRR